VNEKIVQFETGTLSLEVLQWIFNTLPVDITFVGKDDKVQFYSESGERIFVRTKAVIGRTVQACHPEKSLHKVQEILDDFRAGKRKTAEFWINLKDHLIYIRYFAVHDGRGEYLGCLEVTQDVTDIRALQGEKRLLDKP
jgi:PAS domain S-box-containing protein